MKCHYISFCMSEMISTRRTIHNVRNFISKQCKTMHKIRGIVTTWMYNNPMEIKGFSQCIAANKQQACGLAAAASCGMVTACEFFVCKLVLLLLVQGFFFGCLRGSYKAPVPMANTHIFSQFGPKNSQSEVNFHVN